MKSKYLYSSFKNARKLGISNEYLFFLKLKSLELTQIKKGSYIKDLSFRLNLSPGTISNNIKACLRAGFIRDWDSCFVLVSYKKCWNILGFRPGDYVDRFKWDYLNVGLITNSSIKANIFSLEIAFNKHKQNFKEEDKILTKIKYHESTINNVKFKKVRERKKTALLQLKKLFETPNDVVDRSAFEEGSMCMTEGAIQNKISCKRAAAVLGYNSAKTAVNIYKKAQSENLLTVKKENNFIKRCSVSQYLLNYRGDNTVFYKAGVVRKKICNVYSIQNTEFTKTKLTAISFTNSLK